MATTHRIVVELDPTSAKAGISQIDGALKRSSDEARAFERAAAEAMRSVEKSARDAAREQERAAARAAKAAADGARQSAAAQKASARDVEETARAITIAAERRARDRAQVEADAARKSAAAQKQAAETAAAAERARSNAAKQSAAQQKATIDHLTAGYKSIVGPLAEYNQKLSLAIQLERRGAISAQQRAQYVRGLQREVQAHNAQQQGGLRGAVSSIASSQLGAIAGPAAAAAAAIAAGREIIALSDAYANLTNRIRTVTDSEAEAIRVRGQLLELANRTRSDLGATTEGYVRLAAATKNLHLTQSQLLSFTESLSKTIKLSGATSTEAQAGLIQFAQGLGAGALRGDELRSVMEQLGPVADVIAKQLGTTRAGLKAFGEQGKITADVVVAAFAAQREEIDGKFGKSVATFADLWTVLHNSIEAAVGQVVEAVGGMPALTSAIQEVSKSIGEWAHGLSVTVKGLRDLITEIPGLGGAITQLLGNKDVREVLFSSPLGTIGKLSDRYYANRRFGDAIEGTDADKLTKQLAAERAQEVLDEQARKFVASDPQARRAAYEQFATIGQRITDGWRDEAKIAAEAAKAERAHASAAREAAAEKERSLRAYESLNASLSVTYRAELDISKAEETLADAVERGWVTREKADQILARYTATLEDALDPYARAIEKLRDEARVLGLSAAERAHGAAVMALELDLRKKGVELNADQILALERAVDAQEDAAKASEQHNAQLARQQAVYDEVYGPAIKYQQTVEALTAEAARGAITQEQLAFYTAKAKAAFDAATPSVVKMTPLVQQMNDEFAAAGLTMGKFGDMIGQRLAGALDQTLDAVVELANGGKASFADLARSVVMDIEKMILKLLIFQGLKAALGGIGGTGSLISSLGSALGFGGFAAGGSFTVPSGGGGGGTDSVPVYFRATPGERVTITQPGQTPGGGGGATVVNTKTVLVADLHQASLEAMRTPEGTRVVIDILAANPGAFRAAVGR